MSPNNAPQNQDAGSKTATTQPKESLKSICQRSLDSLFDWLAEVRVPIVLWVLFVFLHKPIEEFAVERLVAPVLAHFNTEWPSSLIALGLVLALVAYAFLLGWRRYIVGGKVVLSAFFILLGYGYYRLFRPDFEFYGLFDKACPIVFADLIPLACFVPLFLWIRALCTKRRANQERQAAESVQGFLTDHPLTEEEEEFSGWTSQAQTLTQKLLATDTTRTAFSLGIVASWGEGKSSFMGIMQRYLRRAHPEIIVMRFNPWLYDKETPLTKVFFEELRRTLAPYSSKLSKSIDSYADLLLAVDSSWLKFAHQLLRLSQRSTTEQFDKLSRDIQELGRRVVIFIDDVDRLTREELLELFNLVRNSSNLPCLYFVLAYDKSYVLKTLQSDGEHMSRYPEKIFQEEYPLPKLTPDTMWTVLERCLNKTPLRMEGRDEVSTLLAQLEDKRINLPYHLTTIRMVKRIVNAFNSRYELLHKVGVAPFDLFIFELIYYVYPGVYDFLLEMHREALANIDASPEEHSPNSTYSTSSFFFSHINGEGMQYISIHPEGEEPSGMTPDGDRKEGQASSAQSNEASGNTYPVVDTLKELALGLEDGYKKDIVIRSIAELLDLLWGKKREPVLGQINHVTHWRRYFYRSLLKEKLSNKEFASFLATPDRGKRTTYLNRWAEEMPSAFVQEVLEYTPMNQDEMETIVYAMFDWNTLFSRNMTFHCEEIDSLIRRAAPTDDWGETEFPKILQDKDVLRATFAYTVEWLQIRSSKADILSIKSLQEIQAAIFKEIAKNETCKNLYAWYWLKAREQKGYIKGRPKPELDECMREHIIKEGIEQFSKYTLSRSREQGDFIYYLHNIPWENLTALAEDLRTVSKNQGDNNFLHFIKLALDEEQRQQPKMKLDANSRWGVKVRLTHEQWEPKEEPNFPLSTSRGSHEEYLFYSYPPKENKS